MKRRLLLLCAILFLLSCLATGVFAAETGVSVGGLYFTTLQEAVDSYTGGVILLHGDVSTVTISRDTRIDLNGHQIQSVQVSGGTLYCSDSATDDYTVADNIYGKIAAHTGAVAPAEGYMQVSEADGVSFHRVNLEICEMTLRPDVVGVYYTSNFAADEIVSQRVLQYGVALSVKQEPVPGDAFCGYSWFTDFQPGKDANAAASGTLLKNIMKATNAEAANQRNADIGIMGRAYLQTADGFVFGKTVVRSLKNQVEAVETVWVELTAAQKNAAHQMYQTYGAVMEQWTIPSIKAHKEQLDKFTTRFVNANGYLHYIGNQSNVTLGNLFRQVDDVYEEIDSAGVTLTVSVSQGDVTCTQTPNQANWASTVLDFDGNGIVKLTITDNTEKCAPAELYLKVVDGVNTTAATNADSGNVVLLSNISGTFSVKNGYTFYGNGFTVNCTGRDGSYRNAALSYGFITVENGGVLDNIRLVCDVFPQAYLYTSDMKPGADGRYPFGNSGVVISGKSTISNCYIYGARNNILVSSGDVTISNTVVACGSLSNIQIKSMSDYTVTLDNVTTIQRKESSPYDDTKIVMGFGVLVGDNESVSNPAIRLLGDFRQYNWVTEADCVGDAAVNTSQYAATAISGALQEEAYQHQIVDGVTTVNMGIVYLNSLDASITDARTNADTLPYRLGDITMNVAGFSVAGQVCSIPTGAPVSLNNRYDPTVDKVLPYVPECNAKVAPTVRYAKESAAVTLSPVYQGVEGRWAAELTVDLDGLDAAAYEFSFADLKAEKFGLDLSYEVYDKTGAQLDAQLPISLSEMGKHEYILRVSDCPVFGQKGQIIGFEDREVAFLISATKTSIAAPEFIVDKNAEINAYRLVQAKDGEWRPAYPALDGLSVSYWSKSAQTQKTVDLTTLFDKGTINAAVWKYTDDDFTLTITGGQVHTQGAVISPVVANGKLYFVSKDKAFTTATTSRDIILTYVFADKNDSTTYNFKTNIKHADLSEYDYYAFVDKGILQAPTEPESCLAEGTLITMADGQKRPVESLRKGDQVMVLDHLTGKLSVSNVIIVVRTQSAFYRNTLVFDDGTELATINEHGLFDLELNRYVLINQYNWRAYAGHSFVSVAPDGTLGTKKLIAVNCEFETGFKYDIVTEGTLNYVAEDTLSVTHVLTDIINTFDFGENLTYDAVKMQADITKYGLYTYDEWSSYCDISVFEQYNIPVMKIGVSKGLYSKDYIIHLINTYVLDDSVQIVD